MKDTELVSFITVAGWVLKPTSRRRDLVENLDTVMAFFGRRVDKCLQTAEPVSDEKARYTHTILYYIIYI